MIYLLLTLLSLSVLPVKVGQKKGGSRTMHVGEHVSIHCQLSKLGHIAEHIRWQVLQLVVPQVEILVQYLAHSFLWHLIV